VCMGLQSRETQKRSEINPWMCPLTRTDMVLKTEAAGILTASPTNYKQEFVLAEPSRLCDVSTTCISGGISNQCWVEARFDVASSDASSPEGCQIVAGGRRPPDHRVKMIAPRRGARKMTGLMGLQNAIVEESLWHPAGVQIFFLEESGGLRSAPTTGYFLTTLRVVLLAFARRRVVNLIYWITGSLINGAVKIIVVAVLP
jgi:hypothetical protein